MFKLVGGVMDGEMPGAHRSLNDYRETKSEPINKELIDKPDSNSKKQKNTILSNKILNKSNDIGNISNLVNKITSNENISNKESINKIRNENLNIFENKLKLKQELLFNLKDKFELINNKIITNNNLCEQFLAEMEELEEKKSITENEKEIFDESIDKLANQTLDIQSFLESLDEEQKNIQYQINETQIEIDKLIELQKGLVEQTSMNLNENEYFLVRNEIIELEEKEKVFIDETIDKTITIEIQEKSQETSEFNTNLGIVHVNDKEEEKIERQLHKKHVELDKSLVELDKSLVELDKSLVEQSKSLVELDKSQIKTEKYYSKTTDKLIKPKQKNCNHSLAKEAYQIHAKILKEAKDLRNGLVSALTSESKDLLDLESKHLEAEYKQLAKDKREGKLNGRQTLEYLSPTIKAILLNKGFIEKHENDTFTVNDIPEEKLRELIESIQSDLLDFYANNTPDTMMDELNENDDSDKSSNQDERINSNDQNPDKTKVLYTDNEILKLFRLGKQNEAKEKFFSLLLEIQRNKVNEELEIIKGEEKNLEKYNLKKKYIEKQELKRKEDLSEYHEIQVKKYEHAQETIVETLSVKQIRNLLLNNPKGRAIIRKLEEKIKRVELVEKLPQNPVSDRLLKILTLQVVDFIILNLPAIGVNVTLGINPDIPGTTTTKDSTHT